MRLKVFAAIALLLASPVAANNDLPPLKFQGNPPPSIVIVVDDTNSNDTCGKAPVGWVTRACTFMGKGKKKQVPVLLMPNPCLFPEAADDGSYAHLLCHEFGHANGWSPNHNN